MGRLAGEAINAIFGRSLRGRPMEEFFHGDAYQRIFVRHKRIVTEPALYHGTGPVFHHEGRAGLGERIILPLAAHRRLEARRATDLPRKLLAPIAPLFRDLERAAEVVLVAGKNSQQEEGEVR